MCSVVGCESWRRGAHRFKLPQDPERRLEWVQFLFEINGQRLKESSWTDITICTEHFTDDCFENVTASGTVQVKSSAVPSLCAKSEPEESPPDVEVVQTTHVPSHFVSRGPCTSPTFKSEKSKHSLAGSQASPAEDSGFDHMREKVMNIDSNHEKAALLQMEGKFVVNESCLLQLFRRKCPSCGCKLKMEKVTYGMLIFLNQQCLRCDYRFEWKSQINAIIPTDEDQHLARDTEVSPETQQKMPTDGNPCSAVFSEIVTFSDEESNPSDEGEEGDEGGVSSDGEWSPTEDFMLEEELTKKSEEESEGEGEEEEEEDFTSPGGLKINELCTDCGRFFSILKPHTCEHKIKPYSCNICGKRCVTENSLKVHSKIHDETYEHPCKYCHVTFKTRVDKRKHEQSHQDSKDPFKCPDCPETFVTSKERNIHLSNHRTTREFKCGVCGIEFKDVHHLRRHSVVHTGLKPYKCSVCKRGFNQTNHLKSHMRLHTGERPYKCQHCDHSFNHNVSLKSHIQRFHSSSSGCEQKKNKIKEKASDTDDAKENGNKTDIICESDSVEEEEEVVEKEVQKLKTERPQSRKRSTGRPKGRPKRNSPGNLVLVGKNHGPGSKTKTSKSKVQKLKKTGSSDEESEDSDISFHSAEGEEEEEEEGEKEPVSKNTGRSRLRQNNDSDTDFDPGEEAKKKKYSSLSSSKSSGKCRSRPRKNLPV